MSQKIIRSLFESRLATWAAGQLLPVEYQNVPFDPKGKTTYLRAYQLPAETSSGDLAGDHRLFTGVFQVSIVAQLAKGTGSASAIADAIAAQFPLNLRLTSGGVTVQIISPASEGPAVVDPLSLIVPVSFRYRADTI